jgi:hypothetical protein
MNRPPDYVVIRFGAGMPRGWAGRLDGRWYDRALVPFRLRPVSDLVVAHPEGDLVAVPTGRFEVRDSDGAVAEVWEIQV